MLNLLIIPPIFRFNIIYNILNVLIKAAYLQDTLCSIQQKRATFVLSTNAAPVLGQTKIFVCLIIINLFRQQYIYFKTIFYYNSKKAVLNLY